MDKYKRIVLGVAIDLQFNENGEPRYSDDYWTKQNDKIEELRSKLLLKINALNIPHWRIEFSMIEIDTFLIDIHADSQTDCKRVENEMRKWLQEYKIEHVKHYKFNLSNYTN